MLDDYLVLSDELRSVEFYLFGSVSEFTVFPFVVHKNLITFFQSIDATGGLRTVRYMHEPEAEGHQDPYNLKKLQFKDLFQIVEFSQIEHGISRETGKPGKIGRHFPVREESKGILNGLEKSYKILENSGNFRQMLFVIFSDI